MGKAFPPPISNSVLKFIKTQKLFYISTAPLSSTGHVNCSPKSAEEFRVLDDKTVCYVDNTGSGSETCAHILEPGNNRVTMMFAAFDGPPRIIRLFGHGQILLVDDIVGPKGQSDPVVDKVKAAYHWGKGTTAGDLTKEYPGMRCVIVLHVTRFAHSCGFAVPKFQYVGKRTTLDEFSTKNPRGFIEDYIFEHNSYSIDGIYSVGQMLRPDKPIGKKVVDGFVHAEYAPRIDEKTGKEMPVYGPGGVDMKKVKRGNVVEIMTALIKLRKVIFDLFLWEWNGMMPTSREVYSFVFGVLASMLIYRTKLFKKANQKY